MTEPTELETQHDTEIVGIRRLDNSLMTEPEVQPQAGELLPCPSCRQLTSMGQHPITKLFAVGCTAADCTCPARTGYYLTQEEAAKAWNTRAGLPRATADTPHKLTLPELNHLSALLEAEKESGEESGEYDGPREQYYARTERLIKWCKEQINEREQS